MANYTIFGLDAGTAAQWAGAAASFFAATVALCIALYSSSQIDRRERVRLAYRSLGAIGVGVGALNELDGIQKVLGDAIANGTTPQDWGPNLQARTKALNAAASLGHDDPAVVEGLARTAMWIEAVLEAGDPHEKLRRLAGTASVRADQRNGFINMMTELAARVRLPPPRATDNAAWLES